MKKRKNRTIYGVGINDADYQVSIRDANGVEWRCPFYKVWKNMFARCYSPAYQRNNKTYIGCTVDERWWSFMAFRGWMVEQDWEGKALDKDFMFDGNKVYGPDTCLFLHQSVNRLFTGTGNLYATYKGFYVRIKEFFREDIAAYSFAYARIREGITDIDEILRLREISLQGKVVVDSDGNELSLKLLCKEYDVDYKTVVTRLSPSSGWKDSSLYACLVYNEKPQSPAYVMTTSDGVWYQFTSKDEISDYLHVSSALLNLYIDKCNNNLSKLIKLIREHPKHDGRTLYTIDGVSKYKEDWCKHYGTSKSRVEGAQSRLGIPFEEAVQLVPERVRSVEFNGVKMSVKDLWISFGIDPKRANTVKSQKNYTFLQTLRHFGIDTTDMVVVALWDSRSCLLAPH